MGDFPSGQRGQTVNLLATPSVVRIHHLPPIRTVRLNGSYFYIYISIFIRLSFQPNIIILCKIKGLSNDSPNLILDWVIMRNYHTQGFQLLQQKYPLNKKVPKIDFLMKFSYTFHQ